MCRFVYVYTRLHEWVKTDYMLDEIRPCSSFEILLLRIE